VQARRVRIVEVGFRSALETGLADPEPAAYEWNVQHRAGRFQRKPEESLMLSGDQNMIELTATVHYRLKQPDDFLFRQADGENTVRAASESALQSAITATPLESVLTADRIGVESRVKSMLQDRLDRYRAGVEVLHVKLLDVHPSVEVVEAFRGVSEAFEEKNRLVNVAEGYRNEQIALARGNAAARLEGARGDSTGRRNRAGGDAERFLLFESAARSGPGITETRLYLETMEQALTGKRKVIVDANRGRRHLFLMEDGVPIGPGLAPIAAPQPGPRPPAREEEQERD
jgi:HflK protein